MKRTVAILAVTLALVSCGQRGSKPQPSAEETIAKYGGKPSKSTDGDALDRLAARAAPWKEYSYQRFIPIPRQPENVTGVPWSGAFALDTKTGQLCRTYDGDFAEKWKALPSCLDLFLQPNASPSATP